MEDVDDQVGVSPRFAAAWLPVAGRAAPNVTHLVGCNDYGLAQAPYLGTLVADHVSGAPPHDDLRAAWALDRLSDRAVNAGERAARETAQAV